MAKHEVQSAAEAYRAYRNDISAMVDWLQMALDAHAERAAAQPANWGFAGDLAEVRKRVREVLSLVSGHTEAEIEETLGEAAAG
jgi:hypothetical protein